MANRTRGRGAALSLLLPLIVISPAGAAQPAPATQVPSVVMTATRTALSADQSLADVTVITRADIARSQAQSVPQLLHALAGIDISSNGGAGQPASAFVRGTGSHDVVVLVDGIKVSSATLGLAPLASLPVDQIRRIEIVRGPRSTLYGSEAMGGVIQIFTREPRGRSPFAPWASVGYGSYRSHRAAAGASGRHHRFWYSVSASDYRTAGINACVDPAACFLPALQPDRDGYHQIANAFNAGYDFANGAQVAGHYLRSSGAVEFDGTPFSGNSTQTLIDVLSGKARFSPGANWLVTLAGGRSRDDMRDLYDGAFVDEFDTTHHQFSWQNDFSLGARQMLTVGLDYARDDVVSSTAYTVDHRTDTSLFTEYQGTWAGNDLLLGLRRDLYGQFGGVNTGNIGWGRTVGAFRLTASVGTAFRAPTFNDLYYPNFGNTDLRPERSTSYEVGVARRGAWGHWAVHGYQTDIRDEIVYGYDPNTFTSWVRNIGRARIRGVELTAGTRLAGIDLDGALTLLDARNRTPGADFGNALPRRPQEVLRLDARRRFGAFSTGATLNAASGTFNGLGNTQAIGGYTTVALRAAYHFARDWQIQGRIGNLFDKTYQTAFGYAQPGRNYFVTLIYRPGNTD